MKTIKDWMKEEGPKSYEGASLLSGYLSGVQFGHHLYDVHGVTHDDVVHELTSNEETVPSNMAAVESLMAGAILRVGVTTEDMYWLGACHGVIMNGIEEFAQAEREAQARQEKLVAALTGLTGPRDDQFGLPVTAGKVSGGLN